MVRHRTENDKKTTLDGQSWFVTGPKMTKNDVRWSNDGPKNRTKNVIKP